MNSVLSERRISHHWLSPFATTLGPEFRDAAKTRLYSMTLSAMAARVGEIVKPSAFAVVRLMTRSNLVARPGCLPASPHAESYPHGSRHAGIVRKNLVHRTSTLQPPHNRDCRTLRAT